VVDYDYLIVSVGARPNTFNTPGVTENCHFLKVCTVRPSEAMKSLVELMNKGFSCYLFIFYMDVRFTLGDWVLLPTF
jgi:hypothetical protein